MTALKEPWDAHTDSAKWLVQCVLPPAVSRTHPNISAVHLGLLALVWISMLGVRDGSKCAGQQELVTAALLWLTWTEVLCGLACGHHSSFGHWVRTLLVGGKHNNTYTMFKVGRYALVPALLYFNLLSFSCTSHLLLVFWRPKPHFLFYT